MFNCPEYGQTLEKDLSGTFNILLKGLRDTSKSGKFATFQILPYTVDLGIFLDLPG